MDLNGSRRFLCKVLVFLDRALSGLTSYTGISSLGCRHTTYGWLSHLSASFCFPRGPTLRTRTTPYHPMGNGQCECLNQTLLKMLGTLEEYQKSNWKSHVPSLVHAYHATLSSSTGYSLYILWWLGDTRSWQLTLFLDCLPMHCLT